VLGYERWWTDFVIRATGDEAPPAPGKKNELLVKAYLPYKVDFGLEVVEAEGPKRILSRLSKDFDGSGAWTLETTTGRCATASGRSASTSTRDNRARLGSSEPPRFRRGLRRQGETATVRPYAPMESR